MLPQHTQTQEKELQKLDLRIHNSGQSPPALPTTCRVHLRFKLATISLLHFTLFLLCSWLLESSLRKATTYILVRVPFYARCGIARRPPLICLSKLRAPSFYSPQFRVFLKECTLYSKFRSTNLRLSSQSDNVLFVSTTSNVTQTIVLADFLTSRRCVLIISTQCATKHPFFQILKKELVPLQNRLEKQCFLVIVQMPFTVLCRHLCSCESSASSLGSCMSTVCHCFLHHSFAFNHMPWATWTSAHTKTTCSS